MKKLLFFGLMLLSYTVNAQLRSQLSAYIPVTIPDKAIMPKMSTNVGFGLSYGYSPFYGSPVYFQ